jgi:hypothetical protein
MPTAGSTRASGVPRWLPSPLVLVCGVAAGIIVLATVARGIIDADYFWHLRTGSLILETRAVPSVDPYSFAYDGPWTPHEWLSEVAISLLVRAGGPILATVTFGLVAAAAVSVMAVALARRGVRVAPIAVGLAGATLVLVAYATVRPQVVSWLLLATEMAILLNLDASRARRAWLLVPLLLLWANLHGLWVVGIGILGVYLIFTLLDRTPMRAALGTMAAVGGASALAVMLTPAGPAGILYPLRYLEPGDWGLANIQEWQSPNFHDPAHLGLLAVIVGLIVIGRAGVPGWVTASSAIGVVMALISLRNAPIAALLAMPSLAIGLDARLDAARPIRSPLGRRLLETAMAVIVLGAAFVTLMPVIVRGNDLATRFPVASVDLLAETDPDVRLLIEYGWAGYAIDRITPTGGQVFVDGRNDMYPESILEDYSAIRDAADGWETIVDRYGVEAMVFPPDAPIIGVAVRDSGWCELLRDERQVLISPACESTA